MANKIYKDQSYLRRANMDTIKVIEERRSIRKFKNKTVPKETIERLLELAIKAPSGKNRQPWRFVVLQHRKKDDLVDIMVNAASTYKKHILNCS